MLKFDQKEVTTKDFYGERQITDILTIDINRVVVSDKVIFILYAIKLMGH